MGRVIPLLAITLVALAVMGRQLAQPGMYACVLEDVVWYTNWSRQFTDALASGVLYPRWLPESHAGFGNPTFVFYAPLVHYVTALFMALSGSMLTAAVLTKLVGLWLSGATMFAFARQVWDDRIGLAAALFYMLLPFRVFDLHFLGVYQSKLALAWLPLVLLGATRLATGWRGMWGFSGAYALVCLTHLLSAYLIAPVALAWVLLRARRGDRLRAAARLTAAAALGMALAGIYLIPVLLEAHLVHLDAFRDKEWGRWENNFLFWIGTPKSPFNPPFYPEITTVIAMSLLGAGVAWLASRPWQGWSREERLLGGIVVATLFLMSSLSAPLWAMVPGLDMVLFPTRWSVILVLAAALLAGIGAGRAKDVVAAALVVCGLLVVVAQDAMIIRRACVYPAAELASIDPSEDVEEYVPRTVSLDWLRAVPEAPVLARVDGGPIDVDVHRWEAHHRVLDVALREASVVRLRTFAFPGWQVWVDGDQASLRTEAVSGAMLFDLEAGEHQVAARYRSTAAQRAGMLLSVATMLAWLITLVRRRR